jgi:4-alpha-glucanotransferase
MKIPRGSGTLVHPTSFPGPFGIGDLGPGALTVLDFLAASRQRYWQVLPLHPTGYGDSPYSTLSAFAGNPLLISPERLWEEGLLTTSELEQHPSFPSHRVDYGAVIAWKLQMLQVSFARFREQSDRCEWRDQFQGFCALHRGWLDDYALFAALKDLYHGVAWTDWDSDLAGRKPEALAAARRTLADQIEFQQYL